jgi:membrane protein YqaA with SNARE-associated domain
MVMLDALGMYGGTFAIGIASCFVPIVSIEVFLVGLVVARGTGSLGAACALVALATVGQVLGKLPVYFATRGLTNLEGRHRRWLDRLKGWMARTRCRPDIVLAASALLGLPPFALASTAAGALEIPPARFSLIIGVCRALRFTALIAIAGRF